MLLKWNLFCYTRISYIRGIYTDIYFGRLINLDFFYIKLETYITNNNRRWGIVAFSLKKWGCGNNQIRLIISDGLINI